MWENAHFSGGNGEFNEYGWKVGVSISFPGCWENEFLLLGNCKFILGRDGKV